MIGRLKGRIVSVISETAIIDVGGVGYEINANLRLLQRLPVGADVTLAVETVVREDFIRLYGFESDHDRQCFRLLQSVQGVGAKHALSILQVLPPSALYDAIAAEDITAVSSAHGIGKRIAQRIVTELQPKLGTLAGETGDGFTKTASEKTRVNSQDKVNEHNPEAVVREDTVSALINLGYDSMAARKAVNMAAQSVDVLTVEGLIPLALKELSAR